MVIKRTLYGFMLLLLAAIIAMAGLTLWLNTQPTLWGGARDFIASELEGLSDELDIEVGAAAIKWSGWKRRTVLTIDDIALHDRGKQVSAYLENIVLDIDSTALLFKQQFVVYDLSADSVKLALHSRDASTGDKPVVDRKMITQKLARYVGQTKLPLHQVHINRLDVMQAQNGVESKWSVQQAVFSMTTPQGVLEMNGEWGLSQQGQLSTMSFNAQVEDTGRVIVHGDWHDATPALIARLFPSLSWMSAAPLQAHIEFDTAIDEQGELEETRFAVYTDKRLMTAPDQTIGQGRQLALRGRLQWAYREAHERYLPEIWVTANAYHIPVTDLQHYWPPTFGKLQRKWVTERFLEGVASHTQARLHITPQDIINRRASKGGLDVTVQYHGARLKYLLAFSELENASGTIRFDWNNMYAEVDYAHTDGVVITDGKVTINNMQTKGTPLKTLFEIGGEATGPAKSVLSFFVTPQAGADASQLEKHTVTGNASGSFQLNFPYKKQLTLDDLRLSAQMQLTELSIDNIWQNKPLYAPSLQLKGEGLEVVFMGDVQLEGDAFSIEYRQQLTAEKTRPRFLQVATVQPPARVGELIGLPQLGEYFSGDVQLEAALDMYPERFDIALTAGGEQLNVDFPLLVRELNTAQDILLDAQMTWLRDEATLQVRSAMLNVGEQRMEGAATIVPAAKSFYIDVHKATSDMHDASLTYERRADGGTAVTASGKRLHLASLLAWFDEKESVAPLWKQDMEIRALVDEIQLAKDIPLYDTNFQLECTPRYCERIALTGSIGKHSPIYMMFEPQDDDNPAGVNVFEVITSDAGALFRGFGLNDSIRGGQLMVNVVGSFEQPANGRATLSDFRVVDAPVLGRLFTLGSFTAVGEVLRGRGMGFDNLEADFTYQFGQVSLEKLKAIGPAMGITSQGVIDLDGNAIDIRGSLIPSYQLNTVVSKIPLFGKMLSGGEDSGLFASRYRMEGELANPDIKVNPLSMLTPGVLQHLWGE